ncbi:hypothetical protein C8Q73DRAFT_640408 [Cubamyces lactineus]|nr:hypothetical protein C8Q73DRAFT_640408 [Cubamyces lactineus]
MANRRDTGERIGGRGGRSANKENKVATLRTVESEKAGPQAEEVEKPVRRSASMELPVLRPPAEPASPGPSQAYAPESSTSSSALAFYETTALSAPVLDQELYNRVFRTPDVFDLLTSGRFEEAALCGTPPQTPGLSPSKSSASKFNIPPESPYDPLRTPAFRHSPARLPSDQPWRASSAAVNQAVRQLTLGMLVCGEASPNVRGLDVSPIVIVPASERKKRSIFSPPTQQTPGPERRLALLDALSEQEPDMLFPSPRRLFADPDRTDQTSSIIARMGDFSWSSPSKDFGNSLWSMATPAGEVEDPFKAYLHLSPAPKVAGDSSPAHPPSSSTSASPASRKKSDISSIFADFLQSPTPPSGLSRASASLSRLRYEVFPAADKDVEMAAADDVPSLAEPATLGPSTPPRLSEHSHRRSDSSSSADANDVPSSSAPPSSGSGKAPVSSSGSASIHSRRDSSPFQFGSHGRQRSSSSAGPSSSSSSHKSGHGLSAATVGLMDKILGQRSQRRRTSHNHDSDVAVDAMGSPFKLGRKTSRNEFFYSIDGDCEMQEAQPKKRRKTISGRD